MDTTLSQSSSAQQLEQLEQLAGVSKQRAVWLRVGQLIDGASERPVRNVDIVFDAKQILFVGIQPPIALLAPGQTEPDAVLPDHTVLPCLIEAHAHMFLDGGPIDFEQRKQYLKRSSDWMLDRARTRWQALLAIGVGTVRDAGDNCGVGLTLAKEAKAAMGEIAVSPWIDSPGAAIHHRGRYGSFMGDPIEDFDTVDDCVAARAANGADRIKLLVSGIINFKAGRVTAPPQMDVAEVSAIVQAAKQHGRQTFAHASGTDGVENAIEGGVTSVEHGFLSPKTNSIVCATAESPGCRRLLRSSCRLIVLMSWAGTLKSSSISSGSSTHISRCSCLGIAEG